MDNKENKIEPGTPVFVTGATGFTGSLLTKKLVEAGLDVSVLVRHTSDLSPLKGMNIKLHYGDVADDKVLKPALKNIQYVFHLAAALREAKYSYNDYYNIHVKSTQIICREVIKNKDFKRYIHVSTIGVHGHIDDPPANEESRFNPGDDYQKTKLEAELWLRKFAGMQNFSYTIIRPAAIYGPGDRRLLKLFKLSLQPVFILLGKGKYVYHLVHVDDLTNAIVLSATSTKADREAFIIGSEEPVSIPGIAKIISNHYNKKFRQIRLPITPVFWAAGLCESICKGLKVEPPLYKRRVAFFSKDRHFDVSKMIGVLGYTPMQIDKDGIIETAEWYRKHGWL